MRAVKINLPVHQAGIRNIAILFFSLVLTLAIFSQISAAKPKPTSDVGLGGKTNPSDWLYYKSSNDLSAYLGKKSSNFPIVRYQKDNDYLQFSLNNVSSTTSASLETNTKTPNTPTLFYRNAFSDTDVTYQITKVPFKIKEEIILKQKPIKPTSDVGLEFFFNAETTGKPVKQKDGSVAFFDENNNYLFNLEKPFMIDAKGTRSEAVSVDIIPTGNSKPSQINNGYNFQFSITNFQSRLNDSIFKWIPGSLKPFLLLKIDNCKFIGNCKLQIENYEPIKYQIILTADSEWLSTATYPVIIDPTVTHNADSNFTGQFNRIADSDTTSSTQLESYYQELATDKQTLALYHFNNGACANDNSGNAFNLTANGGMTCSATGRFGQSSDYKASGFATTPVSYSNATILDVAISNGTVEAWINPANLTTTQTVIYADSTNDTYIAIGTSGQVTFSTSGSTALVTANNLIPISAWTHIAAVWTSTGHKIYINGIEQASDVNTTTHSNQDYVTYVGVGAGGNTNVFSGSVDELRISLVARTTEEIKAAASRRPYAVYTSPVVDATASVAWNTVNWTEGGVNTGNGEQPYSTNSLVAQWDFNETSGTTATSSTNGSCVTCAGTLTNFASTASQDQAAGTGWTANNKKWGAGALMISSAATADYVSIADPASNVLDPNTNDLTLETWIKTSSITNEIISNNNANGTTCTNNGYYLGIDASGYPVFYLDTNGATAGCDAQISSSITAKVNDSKWHHLVVSVTRGTSAIMYLDGVQIGSDTSVTSYSSITVTGTIYFGGSAGGLDAILDSTRVYSRALSASEILSNYNAGNIEIQTRTGATSDPNDGTWEVWKPTTGETQLLNMDSDAVNWHSDIMASTTIATSTETVIKAEGTGSLKVRMGMASTTAGTVALWHMEETGTSTGTTLYDSTANAKNGTTNGTTVVDGIFGKARKFNEIGDFLSIANSSSLQISTLSISAWLKRGAQGAVTQIIRYNSVGGWSFYIRAGNDLAFGKIGVSECVSTGTIPDTNWHLVTVTYDTSTCKFYIDSASVGSPAYANPSFSLTSDLKIGYVEDSGNVLKSTIDEVQVLNRVLSPDEIAEAYRMGANHHLTREVSATDLSAKTKLPFWIAADRPGTYLEAMLGESDYANYEIASSTAALSTNTVLYIKGDEIAGSTSIKDSSFSGKTITANGDAKTSGGGKIGNAVAFDGTGDYLRVSSASDWKFLHGAEDTTGFKWSYDEWISIDSIGGRAVLIATNYNTNPGLELTIETNASLRVEMATQGGGSSPVMSYNSAASVYPNNGKWHHVAVTYDQSLSSNNMKWYIDGVLAVTATKSANTPSTADPAHPLSIGEEGGQSWTFNGKRDELRIIKNQILTPDQIRQAYEYGLRTHPITIDFGASFQPSDLISSATDYNFSLTATTSGASATTTGLYLGDKIIIKENLGGTEYTAQGTVNAINTTTGAITVPSWDSGSTFPASNGYSPNATVFKWQREYFDITGAATTTRDAITNLTLRPTNGAEGRTIYLDDFRSNTNYLTASSSSAITSGNNRYLQYRAILTSTDTFVSPFLSAFNTLYTSLATMFPPIIGVSGGGFLSF